MELAGRSALVTGGAGGLGGATVRHLVGLGMFVAIFDQNASGGAALADELGDRAVAIAGDVTEDGDVSAAVDAARAVARCPCSSMWREAGCAASASCLETELLTTKERSSTPCR